MTTHSVLSPSAAYRWIACTPSARLEEGLQSTSVYAEEGTLAHSMAEAILKAPKGKLTKKRKETFEANKLYTPDMLHEVDKYVDYVNSITTPTAQRFIEVKLDMSFLSPGQVGTADTIIIDNRVLSVIDLKYGKGVKVNAEDNPQQMLYAAAALQMFHILYDIETVKLCIHQPRLDHISEWEISSSYLCRWIDGTAIPAAVKAYAGEGDTVAGDHCKFCKIKGKCRTFAELNTSLAEYQFKEAPLLTNTEIADILKRIPMFKDWVSSIEDYSREQLLSGNKIPGYKLVEGRGQRKIINPTGLAETLQKEGYDWNDIYETELLNITALEKLVGRKKFATLAADYIERISGSPTMALESDSRPEYSESIFKPVI